MQNSKKSLLDAIIMIFCFMKKCPRQGLLFRCNGHLEVEGYSDADWARSPDCRRSTTGSCVFVGGNIIS